MLDTAHPYRYVKASVQPLVPPRPARKPRLKRIIAPALITVGSLLIANVAWPIIQSEVVITSQLKREPIVSARPSTSSINVIPSSTRDQAPTIPLPAPRTPQVLGQDVDYTKARNWFPTAEFPDASAYNVTKYTISIPAIDVYNAEVVIGGESLEEGLIHYPGTSRPGQLGSPVIFGHSVLRSFYNPDEANPNRYKSIFSYIMTLEEGDEIIVDFDNITYTYKMKEKVVVEPEDVYILQQQLSNRELKLVTCTPEGTYLRRGIVIAQLVDIKEQ